MLYIYNKLMLKKGSIMKFSYYIAIANKSYLSVIVEFKMFGSYSVMNIEFNYSFYKKD